MFMTRIPSLTVQILKSRKRMALVPTISSAIVTFSKPKDVIQSSLIQSMLFLSVYFITCIYDSDLARVGGFGNRVSGWKLAIL